MRKKMKAFIEKIPFPIGALFSVVPFQYKLGSEYLVSKDRINKFTEITEESKKEVIFQKTYGIVEYAIKNNTFYKEFYKKHNFSINQLNSFDDIKKIPIMTKKDLQEYEIEKRSTVSKGAMIVNTGGTSGQPLSFYLDKKAFSREWAHMHEVWSKLGYKPTDLKLTLRGKNLGEDFLKYNAVHHEYVINAYADLDDVSKELEKILKKRNIKFIHGYPSSIYNFANYLTQRNPELLQLLKSNLKGILLGSEYPAPIYRDVIHSVFDVPSVSWYGHSEMAILAYEEKEYYKYVPFQTYGYSEAVINNNDQYRLIGTSFDNVNSPFIRYDTGDFIKPHLNSNGVMSSFIISEGRIGEFVYDFQGNSISLTALIFGRHHKAFEKADFVQIEQSMNGYANVYVTQRSGIEEKNNWSVEFDFTNVEIEFKYYTLEQPFMTNAGKVPLLITKMGVE